MPDMNLKCFNGKCDKAISFQINRLPQFGFELADIAQKVGWVAGLDLPHSRTLVFCSKECDEATRTKSGNYRLRG